MAKSTQPNFTQQMLQQGFDHIDASMAQDDPEMGALIDSLIARLAGPMAQRMSISAQSLKQLTMTVIRQRSQQMMAEEGETRKTKMQTAQHLGEAERNSALQLAGLKMKEKAFDKQIAMRYVGAALSAAGSFIGQGIASGMFEADAPDPTSSEGYDDLDAGDMDINPHSGRPLTENELTEGPFQQGSVDAAKQKSIADYFRKSAEQREVEVPHSVMKGMHFRQDGGNFDTPLEQPFRGSPKSFELETIPQRDVKLAPIVPAPLKELGSLAPQEPSGMRQTKDKDNFAGILSALRGTV